MAKFSVTFVAHVATSPVEVEAETPEQAVLVANGPTLEGTRAIVLSSDPGFPRRHRPPVSVFVRDGDAWVYDGLNTMAQSVFRSALANSPGFDIAELTAPVLSRPTRARKKP